MTLSPIFSDDFSDNKVLPLLPAGVDLPLDLYIATGAPSTVQAEPEPEPVGQLAALQRTEVTFIEGNVGDLQMLVQGFGPNAEVHVLDPAQDGLQQIAAVLAGRGGIDALHIIAHGERASVNLGALQLDNGNLAAHSAELRAIGASLAPDADILLYSCDTAQGSDGAAFVDRLAIATGADVAASNNLTGAAARGGDWNLEVSNGHIDTPSVVNPALAALYSQVLSISSATLTFDTPSSFDVPGSESDAATDIVYNVNGNSAYQLRINGLTKGIVSYANSGYVASDSDTGDGETGIDFSFDTGQVFTPTSLRIANYQGNDTQKLIFKGYDAAGNLVGAAQPVNTSAITSQYVTINFSGLTNISKLKLTADPTSSTPDKLVYLVFDDLHLSNIQPGAPTVTSVTSVTSSTANGAYKAGQTVAITVTFSSAVDVTGTPQLKVANGGAGQIVDYSGGSGTDTLIFNYTVQPGDTSSDLDLFGTGALTLNGGTIKQTGTSSDATLTLATPGMAGSLGANKNIVIDTTVPGAPSSVAMLAASDRGTSSSDGVTNLSTPTITGNAETGSTVTLYDTDGSTVIGTGTANSDAFSITITPALSQGSHTITAKATDAAGNVSTASTGLTAIIDMTAPTVAITSNAASLKSGDTATITFIFSEDPGSTFTWDGSAGDVTVTGGTLGAISGTGVTRTATFTPSNGVDAGSASISVLAAAYTDRAGNDGGASSALTINYDTLAPAAPSMPALDFASDSGVSNSDALTDNTTPTITGTAESGSTVTLYDSDGTTSLGTATATGGAWSITPTLSSGVHSLTAKSTDLAGNVSGASAQLAVTIDTAAPTAFAVSVNRASTGAATSGATLATLSASDATAVTYALVAGSDGVDADNGKFTIAGNMLKVGSASLSAGSYQLYLSLIDAAGNVSEVPMVFTVVNVPAVTSIVRAAGAGAGVAAAGTSIDYTVTFSNTVTGVDAGDFTLSSTGSAAGHIATISGSGTTYTVTVNGLSGDGTLRLDLNGSGTGIQSGAGDAIDGGYTAGQSYTLDHTAPAAPAALDLVRASDSGEDDDITSVITPTITGVAEAGSTVKLYDSDGTTVLGTAVASGGTWSITSSALEQGSHILTTRAVDAAGNVSAASGGLVVMVDSTAPVALALSDSSATSANAGAGVRLATLSATDSSAVTYALATGNGFNDADNQAFLISGNGLTVGNASLTPGTYRLYLSATDIAGNVSYLSQEFTVQDAPAVTSIVRTGGAAGGVDHAATAVQYTVTFSEAVNGVDASDFTLTTTGSVSATIAEVSGSGTTYIVTIDGLSGDGTLRLDLNAGGTGIQNSGNVAIAGGYVAGATYTLDHTAPPAPSTPVLAHSDDSGSSQIDNITSVTTPTVTGLAEDGSVVTLYDSDGDTVLGSGVAAGGTWSIAATALADGVHNLTVMATDAAGNKSPASGVLMLTVDTAASAPAALALAGASDSGAMGDGITSVNRPAITGSAEAFSQVTLYGNDGNTVLGVTTADAAGAWRIVSSVLSDGVHMLKAMQTDLAGNSSALSAGLALRIDTQTPAAPGAPVLAAVSDTGIIGDSKTTATKPVISGTAEPNAVIKLYDSDGTTVLGSATANGAGAWSITSSILTVGVHALTVKQSDAAGNESGASISLDLTIETQPPVTAPPTITPPAIVDGVAVQSQAVTLPGGGSGTRIVIPTISADRAETSGSAGVADIPLVTSSAGNLLLAQLPTGFGLSAVGGVSRPVGDSLEQLIAAIKASTPNHAPGDQGHLVGNGANFLSLMASSTPLLIQTVMPTSAAPSSATLVLTGTSTDTQHTALVIDAGQLAAGSKLALNGVDFAAIVGAADVRVANGSKIISGDGASQTFTVEADNHGAVLAGGGSDTLVFGPPTIVPSSATVGMARAVAAIEGGTTLLHGGLGVDSVMLSGTIADYTIEQHESYFVVAAKTQPEQRALVINVERLQFADATLSVQHREVVTAIAGLYRETFDRQADYLGIDFWATAEKQGVSLGAIALEIIGSTEARAKGLAAFSGDTERDLELLYQNIFGRQSDDEGLEFWAGAINQGMSLEQVATAFMTSAEMEVHKIGVQDWDFVLG